jgi:hypothetical protein
MVQGQRGKAKDAFVAIGVNFGFGGKAQMIQGLSAKIVLFLTIGGVKRQMTAGY